MEAQERSIRRVVTGGLLLAITMLLGLTPIGFIPVPTPAGSATIAHIPAIIGGILEGPLVGFLVSLGFGVASFLSPLVPVKDPLVIVFPRLLIGVVSWWVFRTLSRSSTTRLVILLIVLAALTLVASYYVYETSQWLGVVIAAVAVGGAIALALWARRQEAAIISLAAAGVAGSLTNTVLVLSAAVLRKVAGVTPEVALTIGLSQGIPEAIVSAIIVVAVVTAVRQIGRRQRARL